MRKLVFLGTILAVIAAIGRGVTDNHVVSTGASIPFIGTSLSGGRGTILGTIIGAFIMSVLTNGLRIMGVAQEWQIVVTGVIIIVAVYVDMVLRRKA